MRHPARLARTVVLAALLLGAAAPMASAAPFGPVSTGLGRPVLDDDPPVAEHGEMSPSDHQEAVAPADGEPEHEEMTDSDHQEVAIPGEEHSERTPRPRALVLGSFALINVAVLAAAAILRRRTPPKVRRGPAARTTVPSAA
ncbi:hypothetical protein [Cellulomonas sp. KRMCY2]|uniref:hypothetical protein n=1 Tax=Cellulomonas sp. KRMCY2 TaxID=1304865 RepID=UPI00045E5E2E|nr:hypothetical protein [Cellulomonas sp. KRMCY2]